MPALESDLRRQLESVVVQAREAAEAAARSALVKRAVDVAEPFPHFGPKEKELRNRLRARGRQVGDMRSADKKQSIDQLTQELAYEFWHRMLFARFLAENQLLMHPEGVAVSLEECEELAKEADPPAPNGFVLAARYAGRMLPQIFRTDDVLLEIDFAPEQRLALEKLLASLPQRTFLADDSLGWVYQFWQSKKKDEVNKSGDKIDGRTLPVVTQLFTENYIVDFLLDNTLGAWHAGKMLIAKPALAETAQSEQELRDAVALPRCPWAYLRFIKAKDEKWRPAASTYDGWPKAAKHLKCLDPCMGSGHFLVAMFERLVALRILEERLDEAAAIAAVIRDNLFGLEIDPRCTQIAAFNLALAAWRRVGHCTLPSMNLACSGLAPNTREADWLAMAGDNEKLKSGMERLYRLFKDAAILGSLINPRAVESDLVAAGFHELRPLLEKALAQETKDDAAYEMAVTARGLAKAAEILASQFTLVVTNVPYLGRRKQHQVLKDYCDRVYPEAKSELATCFIKRSLAFCGNGGSASLLAPQNWLFLTSFEPFRKKLLTSALWDFVCRMGSKAFQTPMYDFGVVMHSFTTQKPSKMSKLVGLDVGAALSPESKATALFNCDLSLVSQLDQLKNPDTAIVFEKPSTLPLLLNYADSLQGSGLADIIVFRKLFWELEKCSNGWVLHQSSPDGVNPYSGMHFVVKWDDGKGPLASSPEATIRGRSAWGKKAVLCAWLGRLPAGLYLGTLFDNSAAAIVPKDSAHLDAIWCFVSSPGYSREVRKINQKTQVANATLVKVPFDLEYWQQVAAQEYPHGLPKPFSSDPTQWLFNGHPDGSDQPIHVAVARLLGYQWPRQTKSSVPDCPALGPDGLEKLVDGDGIACIPAVRTKTLAAERLLEVLRAAYGETWSDSKLHKLLTDAGGKVGTTLDDWLQNQFFEQHCKWFHQRPFIWHIWDGRKDGFSALVNYHKLDYKSLENLTYSYLGDWITAQSKSDKPGADLRLGAAQALQKKLEFILAGEPPYDIFVRWKPLYEQAIGWHPDLNDGVRMNIRPFVKADVLRKPPSIKWTKDRGKEPERDKDDYPWFNAAGERVNDIHLTNAVKQRSRKNAD